jgi:5-oxoprolinase (ATP-hydrolysing)
MLEVFNNLFMNIAEQMGATLQNTAYSVNIKERLDFSCALFDAEGQSRGQRAPCAGASRLHVRRRAHRRAAEQAGDIAPGDAFMLNAPFNGGTHLPDVTVITPVFGEDGDDILFWVGSRGHHADIGGKTPGSGPPDSTHIEEEGVLIDNFRLVERGTFRAEDTRALLASGPYPCRNVDQNMADLEAQIAANETGIREVRAMIANFGLDTVLAYMRHVQDNAEASVRRVIGSLTDGACTYPLDDGSEIRVAITVDRDRGEAVIDFTGTSPQHPRNYNAPKAIATAAVLYVFRTLVGRDIPLNEGCLKPLRLILPERSMINPEYPAAVIAGNTEVSQAITEALYGALDVIAGSQGTMNNFIWGNERFQNYETIAGGSGAGPGFDGAPCVQVHMTNTRATDPEVLETRFPVRVERMAHRSGSGGAGMDRRRGHAPRPALPRARHRHHALLPPRSSGPGARGRPSRRHRREPHPARGRHDRTARRKRPGRTRGGRRHRHAHPRRRRLGQTHLIPFIFPKIRSGEREGWKTPRRRNACPSAAFRFQTAMRRPRPLPDSAHARSHEGFGPGASQRPVKRERGENPRLPPQL